MSFFINFFNKLYFYLINKLQFPRKGFTRNHVDSFMIRNINRLPKKTKILDVGAGYKPYGYLFNDHNYESCDFDTVLSDIGDGMKYKHDFYCDITNKIPRNDNFYDVIICNEVLEHVNDPLKALKEINRVLKQNGKLLLTTTQCHGLHQEPHNYFNFLSYGLNYLFKESNFQTIEIQPLGGIYHLLGKVLTNSINIIFTRKLNPIRLIFLPLEFFIRFILLFISVFLFYFDKFDKQKKWTINYGCVCKKN